MNTADLEYRLIYAMLVAGKSASFVEQVCNRLYGRRKKAPFAWFESLHRQGKLAAALRFARSGNYTKMEKGIIELLAAKLDLATCTTVELEQIHGIGPKTSRFFIIWTRPEAEHAALDTHVLKWLRYLGHKAPKSTPSGEKYVALERIVLAEAKARKMTARELDAAIWDYCVANGFSSRNGIWPANLQKR